VCGTCNEGVADAQGTGLDEGRDDGTATGVELRLDGDAASGLIRVGGELEGGVRGQQDSLE